MNCNCFLTHLLRIKSEAIFNISTFKSSFFTPKLLLRDNKRKTLIHYNNIVSANVHSRIHRKVINPVLYASSTIFSVKSKFPYYLSTNNYHFGIIRRNNNKENVDRTSNETKEADEKPSEADGNQASDKNVTLLQKFKSMYKQYWYVLIPVHMATSVVWYGSFFFAAKSGVDIIPLLEKLGITENFLHYLRNSNAGYYGIAYAMYKIASPARYTITLGGTTIAINYLKNRGYIKPVPTREELKVMYADKKDELKEKTEEIKEKYHERRDELVDKYHEKREELLDKYHDKKGVMKDKCKDRRTDFFRKYRRIIRRKREINKDDQEKR